MSITDATTTLDNTWTEQSPVAFTAGTLSSISSCITEVESKLKRGTLSASTSPSTSEVSRWLIRAKQEISEIKNFTWRRRFAYASTVAGTYRYALPPDYGSGNIRIRDTTNDRFIEIYDAYEFDAVYPDLAAVSRGAPYYACIKGRELWFAPAADGVYTIEIDYDRNGDDTTATDFSWLPEIERFRCCDYAVAESFESLHMWDVADRFFNKWGAGIGKAIKADGKRKWKTMNYRCKSIFDKPNYDSPSPASSGNNVTFGDDYLTF
jgi:hypothetical protein